MIFARTLSLLFLGTIICGLVDAAPQFFVSSFKPKCNTFEVAQETTIKIHYEAPDIDLDSNSKNYAPTFLTVVERPVETLEEQRLKHDDPDKRHSKVLTEEIKDIYGSFLHNIHSELSVVEVCIRASKATEKNPMLFHLRVEEIDEEVLDAFEQEKAGKNRVPLLAAEHHWSDIELQMDRMERKLHNVISEADFFRERDALYHKQTDDLHKATLFWPILHCCILLVTGFTQANHIISFFKSKRII